MELLFGKSNKFEVTPMKRLKVYERSKDQRGMDSGVGVWVSRIIVCLALLADRLRFLMLFVEEIFQDGK